MFGLMLAIFIPTILVGYFAIYEIYLTEKFLNEIKREREQERQL